MNENYEAVIADLERKRDALTGMINDLRALAGMSTEERIIAPAETPNRERKGRGATAIRDDQFFGMPLRQAVRECLRLIDHPMTAPEIARTLKAHGLPSDKKGYTNSVYTALYREQKAGHIVQVPPGSSWGLIAWYPHLKGTTGRPKATAGNGSTVPVADATSEPDQSS